MYALKIKTLPKVSIETNFNLDAKAGAKEKITAMAAHPALVGGKKRSIIIFAFLWFYSLFGCPNLPVGKNFVRFCPVRSA